MYVCHKWSRHTECSNLTEARWTLNICYHENNVLFRLLRQWLCGSSCTWAHDIPLHTAGTNEPKSVQILQKQDEHYIHVVMKTMYPPGYHHNSFVATNALGHMMYSYTLLVPMNQSVLNKLNKEHNISGHKWFTTHRVLKSHRSKMSIMWDLSTLRVVNHLSFVFVF